MGAPAARCRRPPGSGGPTRRRWRAGCSGGLRHLAAVRAALPHLHASVPAEVLELADPGVLPVLRRHPLGPMLGLYNVTAGWRSFPAGRVHDVGLGVLWDALSGSGVAPGDDGSLWLAPYGVLWLVERPAD